MVARSAVVLIALLVGLTPLSAGRQPAPTRDNLVLITLDGVRTSEIFTGLDAEILRSTLGKDAKLEDQAAYKRFYAPTPEARREKLMPFFWGELMKQHGSIAGNRALKSVVTLTNTHRFSYPGYSEILTGEAHDDVIKSNDRVQNPYRTVLEELRDCLSLPAGGVAAFASWEVFNEIAEQKPGSLTINAGYEAFESSDRGAAEVSRMQFQTPPPWESARYDAYTFYFAMHYLRTARPRVLYLAFDETDDWAHSGRLRSPARRAGAHRRVSEGALDLAAVTARLSPHPRPDHHGSRPRPDDRRLADARCESRGRPGHLDGVHQPGLQTARRMARSRAAAHQSGGGDDGGVDGGRLDGGASGGWECDQIDAGTDSIQDSTAAGPLTRSRRHDETTTRRSLFPGFH